jgi:ribonuclease Y
MNLILTMVIVIISLIIGAIITYLGYNAYLRKKKSTAKELLDNAQGQVEKIKKDQLIKFREEMQQKRSKFNEEFKSKENQLNRTETRIFNKEKELRRMENNLKYQDNRLNLRSQKLTQREEALYEKHERVDKIVDEQNRKLETIAGVSVDEAKKQLIANLENRAKLEAAQLTKEIREEAKAGAQRPFHGSTSQ